MIRIHIDGVERTFRRFLSNSSDCFYNAMDEELKVVRAVGVRFQRSTIAKLFLDFPDLISSFLNTFDLPAIPASYFQR